MPWPGRDVDGWCVPWTFARRIRSTASWSIIWDGVSAGRRRGASGPYRSMSSAGQLNWGLPAWLDRALPHLTLEGVAEDGELGEPAYDTTYGDASRVAPEAEELVGR
jgi:hypothetical protein